MALSLIPLLLSKTKSLFSSRLFQILFLFGVFGFIIWRIHTAAFEAGQNDSDLRTSKQTAEDMGVLIDKISKFHQDREAAEREQIIKIDEIRKERAELLQRLSNEEDTFDKEFSGCFNMPVPDGLRINTQSPGEGSDVP